MAAGSYIIRNYSPEDLDNYLRLQVESEELEPSGGIISARVLSENLGRPNFTPQKDLFVAEYKEILIGCLSVTLEPGIQRAVMNCLVHPLHRRKGIATRLFFSAFERAREAGTKSAEVSVSETNASARGLLNHLGFSFIRYFHEMRLDMNNARLPAARQGAIACRRLKPGEENLLTEIQNRCFADTWGFNPNTTEEIAYRLNMHGRSADDVILTYLDDLPVGYCWTIIDAEANAKKEESKGLIHMLGVDPAFRKQEIGKAVLSNGLKDLKARGIDIVELTVDSENRAACSLYESMGFEVYARIQWYKINVAKTV